MRNIQAEAYLIAHIGVSGALNLLNCSISINDRILKQLQEILHMWQYKVLSKSCIEHIFTNNNNIISEVGVRPKIASDHCVIHATLKHKIIKIHSYKRMVWDYKRGDYDAFRQLLLHAPWYS